MINHCQVVVTASNPDPDPLWPWWPRPWLSGGRSGAATTPPRSRQNSVGETVPEKMLAWIGGTGGYTTCLKGPSLTQNEEYTEYTHYSHDSVKIAQAAI